MAFESLHMALEPYLDVPFNSWLGVILILAYMCAVRSPGVLLLVVYTVSATIFIFDRTATAGEMIKTTALLPLGLGSVLAFLVANRPLKAKLLPAFEKYINFAVYGNIVMMVGTPMGGTLRGICSKVTCVALFIWILQQGRQVGWKTVLLHDKLFVFTAVSKSWIFAHAIYRFILLTLPCFGHGRRHRLLEFYSLALTFALSSSSNLPFEYCFGMADTIVVPAAAGWRAIATTFALIPRDSSYNQTPSNNIGTTADVCMSVVLLAVAGFACFKIAKAPRDLQAKPHT